jgi:hypothetical protein
MNIIESTRRYEAWIAKRTALIPADIQLKHRRMREEVFPFLRATYYRWAQVWPEVCREHTDAPVVLSVGDLHVENFGTWRDADGRLVWGVNDFDEVHPLPFTNDLVRLGVSARLAISAGQLAVAPKTVAFDILDGYADCLKVGGRPFVLADSSTPLREMARNRLNSPELFWKKLSRYAPGRKLPPDEITHALRTLLPDPATPLRFVHRIAGLGSLGKQRFTAIGNWAGGSVAREAKALTPSACVWASGGDHTAHIRYEEILHRSVRCPDPLVTIRGDWLLRRLSPDCFRIELTDLPRERDESQLLYSMGWETANIHLGTARPKTLRKDLDKRRRKWLHHAAHAMLDHLLADWKTWNRG